MTTPNRLQPIVLASVLALSAALNLSNIGFPLAFHTDEQKKVFFIQSGEQDFDHPILMLQIARVANLAAQRSEDLQVAVLGRSLMALVGTLSVLCAYFIARRAMGRWDATAVALSIAVCPTLAVHAHYLKEDTVLVCSLLLSVFCFFRFVTRTGARASIWLGFATGLAFSSHYKAILLVPLYVAAPFFGALRTDPDDVSREGLGGRVRRFYAHLALAGLVATVVFLTVNWPLFRAPSVFMSGMQEEALHAVEGHDITIGWRDYWLGFHFLYSLAPGMRWPALLVALSACLWAVATWTRTSFEDRWLVAYVVVFYLVHEVSPLKPWPDFSRYMLPVVPVLLYLAWRGVEQLRALVPRPVSVSITVLAVACLVLYPLYASSRLVAEIRDDTRLKAQAWLAAHPGRAIFERRASLTPASDVFNVVSIDPADAERQGIDYLVATSFAFGRFDLGARLADQNDEIYDMRRRYADLFKRPYVEIAPDYETFAFSNPVIRIVDLRPSRAAAGRRGGADDSQSTERNESPIGAVEEPSSGATIERELALRGWALDDGGVVQVRVWLDDRPLVEGPLNEMRPDIAGAHPDYSRGTTLHGWRWVTSLPGDVKDGAHELRIQALDARGASREIGRLTIVVAKSR